MYCKAILHPIIKLKFCHNLLYSVHYDWQCCLYTFHDHLGEKKESTSTLDLHILTVNTIHTRLIFYCIITALPLYTMLTTFFLIVR